MTDRPIIFSPPMVRTLIEGRKTQTRRILPPQKGALFSDCVPTGVRSTRGFDIVQLPREKIAEPRYAAGDRLWVREAWRTFVSLDAVSPSEILTPERGAGVAFVAGGGMSISKPPERGFLSGYSLEPRLDLNAFGRLRPSIHMPRWASRLTLTVTEVRLQRLQEISTEDCIAEGIPRADPWRPGAGDERELYSYLWSSLHGDGSYDANPWVVALTFTVEQRNIDALKEAA